MLWIHGTCPRVIWLVSGYMSLRLRHMPVWAVSIQTLDNLVCAFWACLCVNIGLFKTYSFFSLSVLCRTAAHKNWMSFGNFFIVSLFPGCWSLRHNALVRPFVPSPNHNTKKHMLHTKGCTYIMCATTDVNQSF